MNSQTTTLMPPLASDTRTETLRGMHTALPVMLGFIPFALLLGSQATHKGFSVLEVTLLTGLNFGGGSEFAAIRLWTSPPHVLLIVAMSFLVNCRHILMGATLTPFLGGLSKRRALAALFFMCDESWAIALHDARQRQSGRISMPFYLSISACLYLTWIMFTAIGAGLGPHIGNIERYGFDMAFTAVFLVLLKGMWKGARASRSWLVSLVIAAGTYLLVPGAWYVATGAVAGLLSAVYWSKTYDK